MFLIKKETDTFVLRPEATASIVRAYVENTLYNTATVAKFFYIGPMFRAERPQKGRLRQFHQIGCEAIGAYHPYLDAEVIDLAAKVLDAVGITGYVVTINTLGCLNDKKAFSLNLRETLTPHRKKFCEDCQTRMDRNVLRVLDCKNKQCKDIILSLQVGDGHICDDCRAHFAQVKRGLDILGVPYRVDPFLVRGLDYYTKTVFEITHSGLGAQDAVGAGGRYDHLVKELGGPDRGAVGFSLGVERLFLAKGIDHTTALAETPIDCYLIALGEAASLKVLGLLKDFRQAGVRADMDLLEGSLKSSLRRADGRQAKFCIIVGDNEIAKGACLLKNMKASTQEEVGWDAVIERVKEKLPLA
jgi:histidyl-tRNA synthetase